MQTAKVSDGNKDSTGNCSRGHTCYILTKKKIVTGHPCLRPVILATQEADFMRIVV
jgi:hypothetical protein